MTRTKCKGAPGRSDSCDSPKQSEVQAHLSELRLWEFLERQNRQIPVIITVAHFPAYFGLRPLTADSILDRRYLHISPEKKSKEYDASVTDLCVGVIDYNSLLLKGYASPFEEPPYEALQQGDETLIFEVKKTAWEFMRRCVGVEASDKTTIDTNCGYRGHIVQPLHRGTDAETKFVRTHGVIVGKDKAISLQSSGNPETILTTLTEKGIISESHLQRVENGGKIRAAPIIRELGIPCIVLNEHPNVYYREIDRIVQLLKMQDHPAEKASV